MTDKSMFRAEALEQLNSPEQLEQLLRVTDRRAWVSLATVGAMLVSAVVWSVVGQIPITVDGVGILVFPRRVVSFQAPSQGQISQLYVEVGSMVEKGDTIGTISQPGLVEQLKAEKNRLEELTQRNQLVAEVSGRRGELEKEAIRRQRGMLEQRIQSTTQAAETQLRNQKAFIDSQMANVNDVIRTQRALEKNLQERFETFQQLQKEGLSSNDTVLNAKQRLIDNQVRTSELRLKRQEIELSAIQADESYQQQMQQVAEMESQLQELGIQESRTEQTGLETKSDRELQIQSIKNKISQLENELDTRGKIISEYSGRILELTMGEGQIIGAGRRLGSIEAENNDKELLGLGYLSVGDGKKIKPGMDIRITPSNVQRERHGSIIATVKEITPFAVTSDAVASIIGSTDVARDLIQNSSKIQVTAQLEKDSASISGFKWTSGTGPDDAVTAGTTAFVRATVEYRRPITFVIPLLRKWTGV
jgi:HlyD family secretion protein